MTTTDQRLTAIESQITENRRLLRTILERVDRLAGTTRSGDGHRVLADGTRFLPGTGRLGDDDRQRSPEVQAAIARDEAERT